MKSKGVAVNVSMPSEAVVPSLDGAVLVALSRLSGPITGRQVHQLVEVGSEAGVRNVLTRLVRQGIVRVSPAGSALLYSINREHVAWPAVQELAGMRGRFLDRLRAELDGWSPKPRTAAVFGSFARSDGNADSDIDLLLIRQRRTAIGGDAWQAQLSRLRDDVHAWTGNTCQIYDIGAGDLERYVAAGDPLVATWRVDAITVAGTDLRGLLRNAAHGASA